MKRYCVRPSVRLSVPASDHGSKPSVGPAGRRYRSIAARPALSSSDVWRANAGSATFQRSQEAEQSCSFFRLVAVRLHCWTKPASRVAGLTRVLLMLQH